MLQVEIPNSCSGLANFSSNKRGVEDQSHHVSVTASKVAQRRYGLNHIFAPPYLWLSDAQ